MLEAQCTKCKETFVPHDEEDTIHGEREDGTPCGGQGVIQGEWISPRVVALDGQWSITNFHQRGDKTFIVLQKDKTS